MILGLAIGAARRPPEVVGETEGWVRETEDRLQNAKCLTRMGINDLFITVLASEFNINKVDLELLLCLDTDQERWAATSGDHFVRVMLRLEDEGKGTLEFLENGLDQFREGDTLVWLRIVDVFCEDGHGFGIGFALKLVAAVLEDETKGGGIGDNTIVHNDKIAVGVWAQRVAVHDRRGAMGCPTCVRDRDLRVENFGCVYVCGGDTLTETGNFTDLLEVKHFARSIAINTNAGRVVTTILLTCEAVAKDITNFLAILTKMKKTQWGKVVMGEDGKKIGYLGFKIAAVAKNTTHDE
jgi:hypothetical protein